VAKADGFALSSMKLAIALFAINLLGCATAAIPQHASSNAGAGQPSIVRDGDGASTNTGTPNGGATPRPPRPNV